MYYFILLWLALFALLYFLITGQLPAEERFNIKKFVRHLAPIAAAVLFFIAGTPLFMTPVAGLLLAMMAWYVVNWVADIIQNRSRVKIKQASRDFITTSSALLNAGKNFGEVVKRASEQLEPPLANDLQDMGAKKIMAGASFPRMFKDLAIKYKVKELSAIANIVEATEFAGGVRAAARGFSRLGTGLRRNDQRIAERAKATMEPKVAAYAVIAVLAVGLLMDATLAREYFMPVKGRVVLTVAMALLFGLVVITKKLSESKDLD